MALGRAHAAGGEAEACKYEIAPDTNTISTLTGILRQQVIWGPPNYGDKPETDSVRIVWILKSDAPIVAVENGQIVGELRDIRINSRLDDVLDGLVGMSVAVTGATYAATFAADVTLFVLDLQDILRSPPRCSST